MDPGWKGEEDAELTEAAKQNGENWVAVAAMIPGRTNQQCRSRWVYKRQKNTRI
jgi:hypothetical protein